MTTSSHPCSLKDELQAFAATSFYLPRNSSFTFLPSFPPFSVTQDASRTGIWRCVACLLDFELVLTWWFAAEHRQDAGSSTSKDGSGASISTPFFKHDNIMDLATGAPGSRVEPRQANGRMCFACVIQDNSPNVIYNGNWILNNEKPRGTTHSTTSQASGVSLTFNGTYICCFPATKF